MLWGWAAMLCGREVCYACQLLEYSDECCWEMESCTAQKKNKKHCKHKQNSSDKRGESSHCQLHLLIVFTAILSIWNIWPTPAWIAMRFSRKNGVEWSNTIELPQNLVNAILKIKCNVILFFLFEQCNCCRKNTTPTYRLVPYKPHFHYVIQSATVEEALFSPVTIPR